MSVKIATLKKIRPTETYALSPPEVQAWAKGLADLRIEFGKERSFKLDPRSLDRPKIEGIVTASIMIDRQLKPVFNLYPIPSSKYSETAAKVFKEQTSGELRSWLEDQLAKGDDRVMGTDMLVVEMQGSHFKLHRVRFL